MSNPNHAIFRVRPATPADGPAIRALAFRVMDEFGLDPQPDGADADLADAAMSYAFGCFEVLIDADGTLVGTGGLMPLDGGRVELRKMYLLPAVRGQGLGRAMLSHLLGRARALGFTTVELDTATVLGDAIALYARNGFRRLENESAGCGKTSCDQKWQLDLADYRRDTGARPLETSV